MREKILSIVRRDSIAVSWRQRYGSDGKHCLGPRQILFGSDEGSETPNSAPLKSNEGSVISQMDFRNYLKRELLDTEGDASIAAGRVGVLELGNLWHRIFWKLALQLSDSLEFLLKSSWSSWFNNWHHTIFVFYLGTFWVAVSEKTAEVPLKDSKLRTYGNLDMETSN